MPRIAAVAGDQRAPIKINRPKFSDVWAKYPHKSAAADVYKLIGGNIEALYLEDPKKYENACALRLSRAFNYGGLTMTAKGKQYGVKGGDQKIYLLRVNDMMRFVQTNFGDPDLIVIPNGKNRSADFAGKKGVLIFQVTGWSNATGHVTLWNGADCGDKCYFEHEMFFGLGAETTKISFWELK